MKKLNAILVMTMIMVFMVNLAGCGSPKSDSSAPAGSAGGLSYPSVVKIWACNESLPSLGIDSWSELPYYDEVYKRLGTRVEWEILDWDAARNNFPVMIASQSYPDVILWEWANVGAQKYCDEGVLVDVTNYVADGTMPGLSNLLYQYPEAAKQLPASDAGNIINLPTLQRDNELRMIRGPMIRQDWLNNLGLSQPNDLDELYDVLMAFKTGDPTGTGRDDIYPMSAAGWGDSAHGLHNIAYAFGINAWDMVQGFYKVGNTIKLGFVEPEMKDVLNYCRMIYQDGLIDPEFYTYPRGNLDTNFRNSQVGFMYCIQPTTNITEMRKNGVVFELQALEHFKNKFDGKRYYMYRDAVGYWVASYSYAITTNAADPRAVAAFLDYGYTNDGMILSGFGIEGEHYYVNENGERIQMIDDLYDKLPPNAAKTAGNVASFFYPAKFSYVGPTVATFAGLKQTDLEEANYMKIIWAKGDLSRCIPSHIIRQCRTTEETTRMDEIIEAINAGTALGGRPLSGTNPSLGVIDAIIIGEEPLSVWDNVVSDMKRAGVDELLQIMQNTFDRFQKR